MGADFVFKQATQTPPEPPRLTGQAQNDLAALRDWLWQFYLSTVVQSGLLDPVYQQITGEVSFDQLPNPEATTVARAQLTANRAWEAGEQFKVDLKPILSRWTFGGSFTISGTDDEGNPVFDFDLETTDFFVTVTPTGATGTPANDAFRVIAITKGSGGLAVQVAGAPGVGNSVTYDFIVVGQLPDLNTTEEA